MSQDHNGLWAVTPLDGRYFSKIEPLKDYCSEAALILYRTRVECEWFLHLSELPEMRPFLRLTPDQQAQLQQFTLERRSLLPEEVKAFERATNHDVKAVEYYIQQELKRAGIDRDALAFVHFACTSEDINNLSYALMCKDLREKVLLPALDGIIRDLTAKAQLYADLPMLSRTHGQTATPTTMGREFAVFAHRLLRLRRRFAAQTIEGKINGAVGNYNAHVSAFPGLDWRTVARSFIETKLGLTQNTLTTQIENHDSLVEFTSVLAHANTVLIGLCRDVWSYISIGYFTQSVTAGEVGSSTMPHKVNPIDFENAEGNLGVACSLAGHFADKLPVSRWQRDLSDSTVLRTLGVFFGHTLLAWKALRTGLGKITANPEPVAGDLNEAWEVLAEPFQTVMRKHGIADAYDRLKAATRGKHVTRDALHALIDTCNAVPAAEKDRLKAMRPDTYLGLARELTRDFVSQVQTELGGL
jgi:adenylosuccinate lyase